MKVLVLLSLIYGTLFSQDYETLSQQILRDLNYIYQGRAYTGASTFKEGRKFKYDFRAISKYEIEIRRNIDGVCLEEPFIINLKQEYFIQLEANDKCDPAIIISSELDIIYLYVKDRCGNFGGFNLYKRAKDATVLLKEHFYEASRVAQ